MTVTMRLAASAILAGFLALLMVLATACWSGELAAAEPSLPPARQILYRNEWSCDRLQAAGKLPDEPVVGPSSDYWIDRSIAYEDYAAKLRSWAISAIAVCSP